MECLINQPLNTQEGSGLLKALLHNCLCSLPASLGHCPPTHLSNSFKPASFALQMLNSPSWISKAMLVIFCVITIMGLLKDVTQEQVKNVKRLH